MTGVRYPRLQLSAPLRTSNGLRGASPDRCGAPPIAALANQLVPARPRCFRADPKADGAGSLPWWLVFCHGGRELALADRLERLEIPHFLPLASYDRRHPSGKRRVTTRALFDNYLFVTGPYGLMHAKPSDLKGLISAVPVPDVVGLVSDLSRLVDVVELAIRQGVAMGEARPIQPGDAVRVVSGAFEGFTGTLVREKGQDLLLIEVKMVHQAVPLTIEAWRVERIDPS